MYFYNAIRFFASGKRIMISLPISSLVLVQTTTNWTVKFLLTGLRSKAIRAAVKTRALYFLTVNQPYGVAVNDVMLNYSWFDTIKTRQEYVAEMNRGVIT